MFVELNLYEVVSIDVFDQNGPTHSIYSLIVIVLRL